MSLKAETAAASDSGPAKASGAGPLLCKRDLQMISMSYADDRWVAYNLPAAASDYTPAECMETVCAWQHYLALLVHEPHSMHDSACRAIYLQHTYNLARAQSPHAHNKKAACTVRKSAQVAA